MSCLLCPCPPKGTCAASGAPAAPPCFLIIFCNANICVCRTEGACVCCSPRLRGYCEGPLDNVWSLEGGGKNLNLSCTSHSGSLVDRAFHSTVQKHTYSTVVLFIWGMELSDQLTRAVSTHYKSYTFWRAVISDLNWLVDSEEDIKLWEITAETSGSAYIYNIQ